MDEHFKALAFDAIMFARRIQEIDEKIFLRFVEKNCTSDDAASIRALVQAISPKVSRSKNNSTPKKAPEKDVYLLETRAILADLDFLPNRRDLLILVGAVFGEIPDFLAKKGSREAIIDWALRQMTRGAVKERQIRYRMLRQIFLRKRDSSLQDWADIISKPTQ
ncbi:hypothetical protein [Xanthomonas arboricola]|uniref:hypothetical protein n=1 Tax=Xanthomonas arboricola TaxID=56448 RepID=UPI0011AFFB19|nr:hypothetical protein [Xanthomonas arboricola]